MGIYIPSEGDIQLESAALFIRSVIWLLTLAVYSWHVKSLGLPAPYLPAECLPCLTTVASGHRWLFCILHYIINSENPLCTHFFTWGWPFIHFYIVLCRNILCFHFYTLVPYAFVFPLHFLRCTILVLYRWSLFSWLTVSETHHHVTSSVPSSLCQHGKGHESMNKPCSLNC